MPFKFRDLASGVVKSSVEAGSVIPEVRPGQRPVQAAAGFSLLSRF